MAEHNDLNRGELTAALAALAPRRSQFDREQVMYRAGEAAAAAQWRRRQWLSVPAMVSGWLVAAVVGSQLWTPGERPMVAGDPPAAVHSNDTVHPPVERWAPHAETIIGAADPLRSGHASGEADSMFSDRPGEVSSSGTALLAVERLLRPADVRSVSRAGRLTPDHSASDPQAADRVPAALSVPARTNFELRREFSASPDIL